MLTHPSIQPLSSSLLGMLTDPDINTISSSLPNSQRAGVLPLELSVVPRPNRKEGTL